MKLQTKGNGSDSQFVSQHNIPSVQAFSDTSVVLAAYLEALNSLLVMSSSDTVSETMMRSLYQNWSTLSNVRHEIDSDLEKADVLLEAIEAKLTI